MAASLDHPGCCQNCRAPLHGPFCGQCGQKHSALNPSLRTLLTELIDELLNVDGRLLQSARLLLTRPGALSLEHSAGRRAPYLSPIRLYLLFSVAYFAITALAPVSNVQVTCTSCAPEQRELAARHMSEALVLWMPRMMFLLVPLFALLVARATRPSGRNYPQHLYFAMHVHAAWFLAAALPAMSGFTGRRLVREALSAVVVIYAAVYLFLALRRAYALARWPALWRTAVIGLAYLLVSLSTVSAIVLPVVFRELTPE